MPPWGAKRAGAKSVVPYAGIDPDQVQRVLLLFLCAAISALFKHSGHPDKLAAVYSKGQQRVSDKVFQPLTTAARANAPTRSHVRTSARALRCDLPAGRRWPANILRRDSAQHWFCPHTRLMTHFSPPARSFVLFTALLAALFAPPGAAADNAAAAAESPDAAAPVAYKFTSGLYNFTGGNLPTGQGLDLNLRASRGDGNWWVGWFRSPLLQVHQTRAGWDHTYTAGPVRWMPSLQLASGGFVGGSLGFETGDTWFAGAGLGRTNLRSYVNLNFDPNDAVMLSGGYRWTDKSVLTAQLIRDNRQNPDQQHIHLIYKTPIRQDDRLTLDLLHKQGLVDGVRIHRLGVSAGYDWPQYFVRLAWDPQTNFTAQDMLRLSLGMRF